jgi:hypothetical protein
VCISKLSLLFTRLYIHAYSSLYTWTIVCLSATKFEPLCFRCWASFCLCFEHTDYRDFVWLCLLPACVCVSHKTHYNLAMSQGGGGARQNGPTESVVNCLGQGLIDGSPAIWSNKGLRGMKCYDSVNCHLCYWMQGARLQSGSKSATHYGQHGCHFVFNTLKKGMRPWCWTSGGENRKWLHAVLVKILQLCEASWRWNGDEEDWLRITEVKLSLRFKLAPCHGGVLGTGGIAPLILWLRH